VVEVVKVQKIQDVMILEIPCRASGCRNKIRVNVAIPYNLGAILEQHGFQRAQDGVGYWCPSCRPGAHQLQDHGEVGK